MTKAELRDLRYLDILIDSKQRQIDDLKAKVQHLQAIDYAKDKVQTSGGNSTEALILKICDMESELERDITLLVAKRESVIKVINAIDDLRYRTILDLRYLKSKKWEEIAVAMGYDMRYVLKIHGKALNFIKRH